MQKSIFKLSSQNGTFSWTTMEQELGTCKQSFVAIAVPDNYFACESETALRKIENWFEKEIEQLSAFQSFILFENISSNKT